MDGQQGLWLPCWSEFNDPHVGTGGRPPWRRHQGVAVADDTHRVWDRRLRAGSANPLLHLCAARERIGRGGRRAAVELAHARTVVSTSSAWRARIRAASTPGVPSCRSCSPSGRSESPTVWEQPAVQRVGIHHPGPSTGRSHRRPTDIPRPSSRRERRAIGFGPRGHQEPQESASSPAGVLGRFEVLPQ